MFLFLETFPGGAIASAAPELVRTGCAPWPSKLGFCRFLRRAHGTATIHNRGAESNPSQVMCFPEKPLLAKEAALGAGFNGFGGLAL